MTIGFIFWFLMLLWLIFGVAWNRGFLAGSYGFYGHGLFGFVLFALLGWKVFGFPIHG